LLEQQAYKLHCESENEMRVVVKEVDRVERVARLEEMMEELRSALEGQKKGREALRQYIPAVENLSANTDSQLQELELKMMRLLGEYRPATSLKHLASQPVNIHKH
jgi:hypothetical protein